MIRIISRRLNGQRRDVLRLLGDPPRLTNLTEEFWQTEAGAMLADLRPEIERMAYESTARATLADSIPIAWDEPVILAEAAEWAQRYAYDLVTGLNNNTRRVVQRGVDSFVQTPGMTIGQLRDELTPAFGERRAQTIAVTETTRAYAQGMTLVQQQLQQSGIQMERIWRTSEDERVCPVCGPNADKPERDGWTVGEPPAHPNCRCWVTLELPRGS